MPRHTSFCVIQYTPVRYFLMNHCVWTKTRGPVSDNCDPNFETRKAIVWQRLANQTNPAPFRDATRQRRCSSCSSRFHPQAHSGLCCLIHFHCPKAWRNVVIKDRSDGHGAFYLDFSRHKDSCTTRHSNSTGVCLDPLPGICQENR